MIPYLGSDDAARKLSKLADPQSPLLGIVKLVAENTNFPSAKQGEPSWWDRIGLGSLVQSQSRAEQTTDRIRQLLKSDAPPLTTADLARLFQPVLYTTPAELPVLVNDNNRPYVEGLRGLARHLDALARVPRAEKVTLIPPARAALDQAEQAHVKLADNFHNVGNEGLNKQLSSLLKQPILLADRVIPKQDDIIPGGKNAELAKFCQTMQPILTKYPFRSSNQSGEAAPAEITKGFAPKEGLVWKYAQSASDLVALSGQEWVQNPVLQGMRVAPELLDFLNQAQNVRKAFFGSDGTQPKLTYVLRPAPGQKIGIGLVLDGTEMRPHVPIQRPFVWPAPPGATPGAVGTVEVGDFKTGFGDYQGPWGVFQLFQNADKRELGTRIVQWSEIRGRGGARTQSLDPPAKIEFREFPGGDVDLFNPKFFERLQCPKKAVVLN